MLPRSLALILLALVVTLALPLALDGFLRGGHVTPEQALRHDAAIAQRGAHTHRETDTPARHEHDQAATTAPATSLAADAGPSLLPDSSPLIAGPWLGLLVMVVGLLALLASQPTDRDPRRVLARVAVAVPPPPPRG